MPPRFLSMPKRLRSYFLNSLLIHLFLLGAVSVLLVRSRAWDPEDATIEIESISIEQGAPVSQPEAQPVNDAQAATQVPPVPPPVEPPVVTPATEPLPPANAAAPIGGGGEREGAGEGKGKSEVEKDWVDGHQRERNALPDELGRYVSRVLARINETKRYPREAQFNEQEGTVTLLLEVAPDGSLVRVEMESPCPFESLNQAALEAVRKVGRLPPTPTPRSLIFHIPIRFQIR